MRLQSNEELAQKGIDELATILLCSNSCTSSTNEMKHIITQQRRRSLAMWHDHATEWLPYGNSPHS